MVVRDNHKWGNKGWGNQRPAEPAEPPKRPDTDTKPKNKGKEEKKKKKEEDGDDDVPVILRDEGSDEDKDPDHHPGSGPGGGCADFGMALMHIGRIMMKRGRQAIWGLS